MSDPEKLLTFDEFRAASVAVLREHHEHFADPAAADAILQPGAIVLAGWREWPPESVTA